MIEINVDLGDRAYPILVGAGARHRLIEVLPQGVQKVAIITQTGIDVTVDPGVPYIVCVIGEGEKIKNLETVEDLCSQFAQFGMSRKDCIVGLGGGLVTDIAGFTAAIYHRGVNFVQIPTTLLGQVDAAIGGKTGVNLPEGKNLVGAFWQPSAVLCDTQVLEKLPPREYLSGTGEMAKYHFLGSRVGMDGDNLKDLPLDERVAYCAALKAKVVAADEREGSLRLILNYGHTLGHALEVVTDYDLRHGESVAIGIHFAALLAQRLGRIDQAAVDAHLKVLEFYSLPVNLPEGISLDRLIEFMSRDKKAHGDLAFVLDGPKGVELVNNVDAATVREVLTMMSA